MLSLTTVISLSVLAIGLGIVLACGDSPAPEPVSSDHVAVAPEAVPSSKILPSPSSAQESKVKTSPSATAVPEIMTTSGPVAATNIPFPTPKSPSTRTRNRTPRPVPTPTLVETILGNVQTGSEDAGGVTFEVDFEIEVPSNGRTDATTLTYMGKHEPLLDYTYVDVSVTNAGEVTHAKSISFNEATWVYTDSTDDWTILAHYDTPYYMEFEPFFFIAPRDQWTLVGTEEIDGVDTHRIEGGRINLRIGGVNAVMDCTVWIDVKDGLTRRIEGTGEVAIPEDHALIARPDDGIYPAVRMTADFTEYGPVQAETPTIHHNRSGHQAFSLDDGRVLVSGGSIDLYELFSLPFSPHLVQVYDPETEVWTFVKEPLLLLDDQVQFNQSMLKLPDGRVMFVGVGSGSSADIVGMSSVYDPAAPTLSQMQGPSLPRGKPGLALLKDGRVMSAGGSLLKDIMDAGGRSDEVEVLDPSSGSWQTAAPMSIAPQHLWLFTLEDGRVLALSRGGGDTASFAETYGPAADIWTPLSSHDTSYRLADALQLHDGRLLVIGHNTPDDRVYNLSSDTWVSTGARADARTNFATTLLTDGRVLITGGEDPGRADYVPYAKTEVFDPATLLWVPGPDLATPRSDHSATLLPDGRVFLVGGLGLSTSDTRLPLLSETLSIP